MPADAITLSVVTVSCNSAPLLGECLASVASQDLAAQHVIIDRESSDGTIALLRSRSRASGGDRLQWSSEPDRGIYDAMNKGISRATGDIVGLLNADDTYADSRVLGRVQALFHNDPELDACYGDLVYISRARRQTAPPRIVRYWRSGGYHRDKFLKGWMPPHPTFFVRRQLYERLGSFRLDLGSSADYELMLRFCMKHNVTPAYIPEILVRMRTGGQSAASWRHRLSAHRMDYRAWRVNELKRYPWTLPLKPIRKIHQWLMRPVP